ncbi:MAG TPA: NF041680 family putative transposase [Streptosporangiaceae bacterium]|nr:NF041680 family putative transposase [Streptosporangiaceae bacterium]
MAFSIAWLEAEVEPEAEGDQVQARDRLASFRGELYRCFTARADELFELADAVLCADGPVKTLAGLSLAAEHRRGHGAMYDGLNHGRIDMSSLSVALAAITLPRLGGRIVLGVDVTPWLRPDAATSPGRLFCHVHGRRKDEHLLIPGWPYSMVAALEEGRTSWTRLLDARRLLPDDDEAAVTAAQVRDVVARIIGAGQHQPGDPGILLVFDAGYDLARLSFLLGDLPVQVLGRLRSDRVMGRTPPPRVPGTSGRPPRHGDVFKFKDPGSWGAPDAATVTGTTRWGKAEALAFDGLHPRLTRRAAWIGHEGELPVLPGTVIRLKVEHLPGDASPQPMWLWTDRTGLSAGQVDRCWQAFLRRFDIEHTFRFLKQALGWTAPHLRDPAAADTWTWLILAACAQLHLARHLATDLRRPWEKPAQPGRLTPARVRRGFRYLRQTTTRPARAPKPSRPGPGRPKGSKNKITARRHEPGKTTKRDISLKQRRQREG